MSTKKKSNESNKRNKTLKRTNKKGIKFITISDILNDSQQNVEKDKQDRCDDSKLKPVFDTFEDKYEEELKEKKIDILRNI